MKNKFNIHSYLEQTKFRAIILLPPLILVIIGLIIVLLHVHSNFGFVIPFFVRVTGIVSSIWLLLSMWFVLWSDYKRAKNN